MRQRVVGDGPRTDQNIDRQGVKRSEVPPAENFPGCLGGCLSGVCVPWSSVCVSGSWPCCCLFLPGAGCWVPVSGALASSLWLLPCLPGSGSCTGFRGKGRRPKNRSRRSIARAGLFQVFPGMLAVLVRRYRGCILTLVRIVVYSPSFIASPISGKASPHAFNPPAGAGGRTSACRAGSQWRFTFPSMSLSSLLLLPLCGCSNLRYESHRSPTYLPQRDFTGVGLS